jgi:hypothetical protein
LIEQLSTVLKSDGAELCQRAICFLTISCTEQNQSVFLPVLPLFSEKARSGPPFLLDLLKLFRVMINFEDLFFQVNKELTRFSDLLRSDQIDVQLILLDIINFHLNSYSPSAQLTSSFLSQLPLLIHHEQLHEPILCVLTHLINNQYTFTAIAKMRSETPLLNMLSAAPPIVIHTLKLIFLLLSNPQTAGTVAIARIQPLLESTNPSISRLAAMCLTISPDSSIVINDSISQFFARAFDHESELTLDALRLAGVVSKTDAGRESLATFLPLIVNFLSGSDIGLTRMALLVLTSLSIYDQFSERLVAAVPVSVALLEAVETTEHALAFLSNMTVNFDAAIQASSSITKLVSILISGDIRALVPIHRIVTLPDCFEAFLPSLEVFIVHSQPMLETGLAPVLLEIVDAVVQHAEGREILKRLGIGETLRKLLAELPATNPGRSALVRVITRIK